MYKIIIDSEKKTKKKGKKVGAVAPFVLEVYRKFKKKNKPEHNSGFLRKTWPSQSNAISQAAYQATNIYFAATKRERPVYPAAGRTERQGKGERSVKRGRYRRKV